MPRDAATRRLLLVAERQQAAALADTATLVTAQFGAVNLADAETALKRALSLPAARRRVALPDTLRLIDAATSGLRAPAPAYGALLGRATRDRVLNSDDLSALQDPGLRVNDPAELIAAAVKHQRRQMNGYWAGETDRFRSDVAATIRHAARTGLGPDEAAQLLQDRLGVHASRAKLISVDMLLTAMSRAEITRLKQLGYKRFQWQTRLDASVRDSHARHEGVVYTWAGAPELPGQAIRCRCRSLGHK